MSQTVAFSKDAVNVFFHILTKCNLSCRHCYINPDQHGTQILSEDTVDVWLSAFKDNAPKANVIFLGGEPTLHPKLPQMIRSARAMGYQSITVDTNGYLFHDFLDHVTPDEVDFVSFSLDGATPETNDYLRGDGCFEACINGVKKSVSRGFKTSMIYTVSQANFHELDQMIPLIKELGIHRFFIQVIGIRGHSSEDAGTGQLTHDKWLSTVPDIARQISDLGVHVTYPKVFLSDKDMFECGGVNAENYFIFPNGRVYRCPLCEDHPIHSHEFIDDRLVQRPPLNEDDFFKLSIPEGCVMNKMIQPDNITYKPDGTPAYRIACCLIKEDIPPS